MKQATSCAVSQRLWTAVLFFLSFCVWQLCFRLFFMGEIPVVEDALAYFNQIGFFTDSLAKGIFPLWVPDQYFGFPHDFYLLRIGGFNPAYGLLAVAQRFNVPFAFSYTFFMAAYYYVGCIGFYRIARAIVRHRASSIIGFCLLYFSCLGTRIFDSYFILVFTPLIWTVFFAIRFCLRPSRKSFLRLIFLMMILLGTYIPFYAVFILAIGGIVWCCVFFDRVAPLAKRLGIFFRRHWFVTVLGIVAVGSSLAPGVLFFSDAGRGDMVMPGRHGGVDDQESSIVPYTFTARWAVLEEIAFSLDFQNARRIRFAVLFVPILFWVFVLLGSWVRITRCGFFIVLWTGLLFLLGIPQDIPVYMLLAKLIPLFKHFRNLHFFLWIGVLPLLIFLLVQQLKQVFDWIDDKSVWKTMIVIGLAHMCVGFILARFFLPLKISFCALGLSYIGFGLYASKRNFRNLALLLFVCAIAGEFYSVYIHSVSFYWGRSGKNYENGFMRKLSERDLSGVDIHERVKFYVISNTIYQVSQSIEPEIFWRYARDMFRWYDAAKNIAIDEQETPSRLENAFDPGAATCLLNGKTFVSSAKGSRMPRLRVFTTSPNRISVNVESQRDGVLVFNEVYHPDWHVFIDGIQSDLYQANGAFCGVIVPKGGHHIEFVFGGRARRLLTGFLLCLHYGLGFGLLGFSFRHKSRRT